MRKYWQLSSVEDMKKQENEQKFETKFCLLTEHNI